MAFPNNSDELGVPTERDPYPHPYTRFHRSPPLLILHPSIVPPSITPSSVVDERYHSLSTEPPLSPKTKPESAADQTASKPRLLLPPSSESSDSQAVPVVLTNSDISMFTHLAPYLYTANDSDGGEESGVAERRENTRVELNCVICLEAKLEMPAHLSTIPAEDTGTGPLNVESFAVTPCGHILGYACLSASVWARISRGKEPVCPICRFSLVYGCGHLIPMRPYNVRVGRSRQLPVTLPEGGSISSTCRDCDAQEFEDNLGVMESLAYPYHRRCIYIDPAGDGIDQVDELRVALRNDLKKQYRENENRMIRW